MTITAIVQPTVQLGTEIDALLKKGAAQKRIVFVSAFVALKTVIRLRESLLEQIAAGCELSLTVGIDLGGTSKEVLSELLSWDCEINVFYNPSPRSTFHPKIYLFQSTKSATVIIGSNNLTDGGFYTNHEAAIRHDFRLPRELNQYLHLIGPLREFLEPSGGTVRRLNNDLIEALLSRNLLPTEADARKNRREQRQGVVPPDAASNPFSATHAKPPPSIPVSTTSTKRRLSRAPIESTSQVQPAGVQIRKLVWRKVLPKTDAGKVLSGSNPVGGVRLTQAGFEDRIGHKIEHKQYFRDLFSGFDWSKEIGGHADQEHTFVPMRVVIRGKDHGIHIFEISHKPSGAADQANYTTMLRWGNFSPIVAKKNLTGAKLSLYLTTGEDAPFLVEVT